MAADAPAQLLSARETEVLALAWQCMDVQPKIDYKKLALLTGYTEGSASVTFGKIQRKLKNHAAGNGSGGGAAGSPAKPMTTTPKRTGGPGRGKKRGGDGDESPSKKKKTAGKKGKGGEQEMEQGGYGQAEGEDDGGENYTGLQGMGLLGYKDDVKIKVKNEEMDDFEEA